MFKSIWPGVISSLLFVGCTLANDQSKKVNVVHNQMFGDLITLTEIPKIDEIKDYQGKSFYPDFKFDFDKFKKVWVNVKPILAEDPSIPGGHYGPLYSGQFSTKNGTYQFEIFIGGGGGILTNPNRQRGFFSLKDTDV